jgi:hypothetical protein
MVAAIPVIALMASLAAAPSAAGSAPRPPAHDSPAAAPYDSARAAARDSAAPRIVRRFPAIEVRAPIHDMRSSQTVHVLSGSALHALPLDGFVDAIALQAGVVAQGEELHVRGGRSGEMAVLLDGMSIVEPLRHRPMEVPLLAVRSADLVTGAPEAQYGSGLAGTLDVRSVDPDGRASGEARWQRSLNHRGYDRASARVGAPLQAWGLGLVAAGDATVDDNWLPTLRTPVRAGAVLPFHWRVDNRMNGFVKVAPIAAPRRFVAQVLFDRRLQRPYDPSWSLDGWTGFPDAVTALADFRTAPRAGYSRYVAADHLAITDERRLAALVALSTVGADRHGSLGLGWQRARSVTSVGGARDPGYVYANTLFYGSHPELGAGHWEDPFTVVWGDYPLYRASGSDVWSLRADGEMATRNGGWLKAGWGTTLEHATLFELDGTAIGRQLDSLRAYDAWAPGASGYVQGRWSYMGLVANGGLRAEYFTAGHAAGTQTLPGLGHGVWSLSPRLGLAYPISVRDVFSLAYVRVQQEPGRDYLYDRRTQFGPYVIPISPRQPLGNPALVPATVISYEAAVKHLYSAEWALQGSLFYRNIWGQVGTRNHFLTPNVAVPVYENGDEGAAVGIEWGLLHASGQGRRLEAHYTWMQAWGNESRPEGDPYGPLRDPRIEPITDVPLSWDRRHTIAVSASTPIHGNWLLSWSTSAGSPLPWTPKSLRAPVTDLGIVNSRRLAWSEVTNLDVRWTPRRAAWLALAFEARNLFDERGERLVTVDGYPNPVINTEYDDYSAYRTATGNTGGGYWVESSDGSPGHWVAVHDPRLYQEPRTVRMSVGASW